MADSYYRTLTEDASGGRYLASEHTTGPWDARLQHGGPPSALLVRAAEGLVSAETGRTDLVALRYAAEFVGPVPVAEVTVRAELIRSARSAALVSVALSAADRPCLQARVWLVREADTAGIAAALTPLPVPPPGRGLGGSFPYADSIEWRAEHGSLAERGPGTMWARPRLPLLDDDEDVPRGLRHVVLVGDSSSGISAELDWDEWSFLNVDLDVHLARPAHGDWVRIDAATQLGPRGTALCRSTVADEMGTLGATLQTLVLAPRIP